MIFFLEEQALNLKTRMEELCVNCFREGDDVAVKVEDHFLDVGDFVRDKKRNRMDDQEITKKGGMSREFIKFIIQKTRDIGEREREKEKVQTANGRDYVKRDIIIIVFRRCEEK